MLSGVFEVDLVGTNAEAADDEQVLGLAKDLLRQFGLGADADNVDVTGRRVLLASSQAWAGSL